MNTEDTRGRDAATAADQQAAAHDVLREAESLARLLRLVTGGHLTLGVLDNDALSRGALRAYGSWHEAHGAVGQILAAAGEDEMAAARKAADDETYANWPRGNPLHPRQG